MNEDTLDLSGLKCPLPALMAKKALAILPPGFVLTVTATDPMAAVDIPHMCGEEGHMVETVTRREAGGAVLRIRRGPQRPPK